MINYNYECNFSLENEDTYSSWIAKVILSENKELGEINYIFVNDEYLHKLNIEHLNHDTLTDVISFDYSVLNILHGDIFISIDRVKENALIFNTSFTDELKRVMIHGVLHYCGYKDKTKKQEDTMRQKEEEKLLMFHVEH